VPIARLRIQETALLIVDVQERLMPAIADRERVTGNCAILLRMATELSVPSMVTEQYVKGLGRTVPEVSEAMGNPAARLEKTTFSAAVDLVREQLSRWRRSTVLVAGVEAHVCVLQTVLDLQAHGWQAFFVTDAISAGQRGQIPFAFQRMQLAGALPTGVLSAMYELMGDAKHESFRSCLELAKRIVPEERRK